MMKLQKLMKLQYTSLNEFCDSRNTLDYSMLAIETVDFGEMY